MRYTTVVSRIDFIGFIWQPGALCAYSVTLSESDLGNLGEWTRDNVARWLALHSGDFREVTDFRADFSLGKRDWISDWQEEESGLTFADCMEPATLVWEG